MTETTSEAMRLIKQGAVKIAGEKIEDVKLQIMPGTHQVYQVGKRKFAQVELKLI